MFKCFQTFINPLHQSTFSEAFDQSAYITQTARTLGISDIAGALSGYYPSIDILQNNLTFLLRCTADIPNRVPEAVANQDIVLQHFSLQSLTPCRVRLYLLIRIYNREANINA
jgi:hypothetical protein